MLPSPPKQSSVIYSIFAGSTESSPVNVSSIRQFASMGVDTCPDIDRFYTWLILLGICPTVWCRWKPKLDELMAQYSDYVSFTNLNDWNTIYIPPNITIDDFEKDKKLGMIHLDIVRSGRLFFFLPPKPIVNGKKLIERNIDDANDILFEFQEHLRRLERLLFIFQTLHSGLGYMQGFNELAIIFYYVLLKPYIDINKTVSSEDLDTIECLAFHCFQKLMTDTELPEFYTTQDQSSIIMHRLKSFDALIKVHLPVTHDTISALGIHPIFYCLRWFTLLFAQEHDLPSLLMIWDSIFAHFKYMTDYLFYVGLGHLKMIENKLDKNSYSTTIEILQHMKLSGKVKQVLTFAKECWERDKKPVCK